VKRISAFITRYVYAAFSCVYLFTVGFLFEKNRLFIERICAQFGYVKKTPIPIVPTIELSEVVSEESPIQVREPVEIDGNISLAEITVMSKLVKRYNPNRLFEIGTFDGRTTLNLAANTSAEAEVYTLNLPRNKLSATDLPLESGEEKYVDKEVSGARFLGTDCEQKITQLYGDSATFDFSPFFNTVDFIFIDGSHSYEYVLNDSKRALELLRDGRGLILWHDYDKPWWQGLTTALNEMYSAGKEFKNIQHIQGTSLVYLVID
jgi:predicted O-methyltransferase YrrM